MNVMEYKGQLMDDSFSDEFGDEQFAINPSMSPAEMKQEYYKKSLANIGKRKMPPKKSRVYSDEEKLAYYKKKASGAGRKRKARGSYRQTYRGRGGAGTANRAINITGMGEYRMNPEDAFGRRYGGLLGSKAGEFLGGAAQSLISSVTGLGDYTVKSNVLMFDPPPVYNVNNHGGVVVRHREYLADVITSATIGAFKLDSYPLNPAQEITFPFLSQVASCYDEYVLEGVIFEFKSMSADALNSTNTALGSVILATNYNAGAPLFTSKAQMENYEFGQSCKPSINMVHPIECDPRQTSISTNLFTRAAAVPTGQSIQLFDWGNTQIATTGFQAASVNIGELWVSYQVCLLKPKLYSALGEYNLYWHSTSVVGVGNATPYGTAQTVVGTNMIPPMVITSTQITFPASQLVQTYYISINWVGALGGVPTAPGLTYTNCALAPFYTGVGVQDISQAGLAAQTIHCQNFAIVTSGSGLVPNVKPTLAGLVVLADYCTIRIIQMPNSAI